MPAPKIDGHPLNGVEAYIFDVLGTLLDWYGSLTRELGEMLPGEDWDSFVKEWRAGFFAYAREVAKGAPGSTNIDVAHREILDRLLDSPTSGWKHLGPKLGEAERRELVLGAWHRLDAWADCSPGLHALKKDYIIVALTNGSIRLLVDTAKHSNFPWDVVFSTEIFGDYKPNPKVYLETIRHLALPPEKCAMVAAHLFDVRGAAAVGLKTVYVPRSTEDPGERDNVKAKSEGGEFDVVVSSITELAALVAK